jgi:uncharacterized protein (TIGR02246 family)
MTELHAVNVRVAGILLLSVAWLLPASVCAQSSADEAAVRALWQRFEVAFNAGDARTIGSLFTIDADRVNGTGAWVRGRSAIERQYGEMLKRRAADATSEAFHPTITVRMINKDVALVDGEWQGKRGGINTGGRFILIAIRNRDRWLFDAGRAWDYPLPN